MLMVEGFEYYSLRNVISGNLGIEFLNAVLATLKDLVTLRDLVNLRPRTVLLGLSNFIYEVKVYEVNMKREAYPNPVSVFLK